MRVSLFVLFAILALLSLVSAQTNSSSSSSATTYSSSSTSTGAAPVTNITSSSSSSTGGANATFFSSSSSAPYTSCYTCFVPLCTPYLQNPPFTGPVSVQLPSSTQAPGAAVCQALNDDVSLFIGTTNNTNPSCSAQIGGFGCNAMLLVNQTESTCNLTTIGGNVPNATQQFQGGCLQELNSGCLGTFIHSELTQTQACSSFTNFFNALGQIDQDARAQGLLTSSSTAVGGLGTSSTGVNGAWGRVVGYGGVVGVTMALVGLLAL